MNRYQSEAEIQNVVRGFETCETGADPAIPLVRAGSIGRADRI